MAVLVVLNFLAAGLFGYTGHITDATAPRRIALALAALSTANAIAFALYL